MNGAVSAALEHRDEARVSARSPARFDAPWAVFAPSGPAMIEEFSACGLRLRTESQLHPDEELIVKVAGQPFPVHARVVWVREGPPLHRGGHKTWSVGCRLDPESIGKVRLGPAVLDVRAPFPWRRALLVASVIGAVLLVVYLFLRFATIMGGG
jgi:hypothetical protein